MPLGVDIPLNEVKRYMGYRGINDISAETEERIIKVIDQVQKLSQPRMVIREYPIDISGGSAVIRAGNEDVTLTSDSLCKNMKGCCRALLLAATIGPSCDMAVRRAGIASAAEASMYQAAGAAAIEAYLDSENKRLKSEYEAKGLFLRPRFSPGYGDLKLEHQKDWFRLLDITKQIGVELTDSLLMVPTKSVTAIIGIGTDNSRTKGSGCADCNIRTTCDYTKGRR